MPTALTRAISPLLVDCELSHIDRIPININKASEQQQVYEDALKKMGYTIRRLPETPHLSDGVFVEDTAVLFPEIGIITRPGAKSRRTETKTMSGILKEYRNLLYIAEPGTIDGGDVLVLGKRVFIGLSQRTNIEAINQFAEILKPLGYTVQGVSLTNCLHLKTAITPIEDDLLLANSNWIDEDIFDGYNIENVHPDEPFGANVMRKDNWALCSKAYPHTAEWLSKRGYDVVIIDQSELAKAEAGLTCLSVIVDDR